MEFLSRRKISCSISVTEKFPIYRSCNSTSWTDSNACNRNGVWNQTGATVAFTLQPHFYQTIWFYGICVIAAITGVIGIIWLRQVEAKKREAELMRLVELHTAKYRNAAQSMESFNYSI